jgi:hypothetical protein
MADRQAQEFWDNMWYWEKYEIFPGETADDPHLVLNLGAQVDQVVGSGSALRCLCWESHESL